MPKSAGMESGSQPVRQYAVEQLSGLLGRMVFQIHRATRSHEPETIHDLRVSIRRFNQGARVFRQFLPERRLRRLRRRLDRILDLAAAVRDRDVALEHCTQAGAPETAAIMGTLRGQREEAERELRKSLKRVELRDRSARWRARLGL